MIQNPLANISPADVQALKQHQSLPPDQQPANLQRLLGQGLSLSKLFAIQQALNTAKRATDTQSLVAQAEQAGGVPSLMTQATPQQTTVADDLVGRLLAEVQSRQPEVRQMGIAALPAGGVEHMAGGGIVAFGNPELNPNERQLVGTMPDIPYAEQYPYSVGNTKANVSDRESTAGMFLGAVGNTISDFFTPLQKRFAREWKAYTLTPGLFESLTPEERALRVQEAERVANSTPTKSAARQPYIPSDEISTAVAKPPAEIVTAAPSATPSAATPGAARRGAMRTEDFMSPDEARFYKKQMEKLESSTSLPPKSLEEFTREQEKARTEALTKAGLSPMAYKDAIDELTGQAKEARANRDTDQLMAIAQGFFTMAGGTSPYALKNMADGFGVATKEILGAERDYRKAEKARQDSITAFKQAQRAEVLGYPKEAQAAYEKYEMLRERQQQHEEAVAARITGNITTNVSTRARAKEAAESAAAQREAVAVSKQAMLEQRKDEADRKFTLATQSLDLKGKQAVLKSLEKQEEATSNKLTMLGSKAKPAEREKLMRELQGVQSEKTNIMNQLRFASTGGDAGAVDLANPLLR